MNDISSPQNAKFKRWQSLLESKGIKKEGAALVSGEKLVREMIALKPASIEELIYPPKGEFNAVEQAVADHLEHPSDCGTRVAPLSRTRLSSPLFRELDVIGTHSPMAVVRIEPLPAWTRASPRGLELIVSLGDPSNLGALLRSAEAFGVNRVILTKECASPYLPKALKAASLATFRLNLVVTGSVQDLTIDEALGLDMTGEDLANFKWPRDTYLILGEEGAGLPRQLKIQRLKITMASSTESLNATVAASIALFSYRSALA